MLDAVPPHRLLDFEKFRALFLYRGSGPLENSMLSPHIGSGTYSEPHPMYWMRDVVERSEVRVAVYNFLPV